jgi:hypothetical protein
MIKITNSRVLSSTVVFVFMGCMSMAYAESSSRYFPEINQRAFDLGASTQHLSYKEFSGSGVVLDREYGNVPMARASLSIPFTHVRGHPLTFSLDGDFSNGRLTYDGATWGGTPLKFQAKHRIYDYVSGLSYLYASSASWAIEPMMSLGYHRWHRGVDAAAHPGHYGEFYSHYNWFVGGVFRYALTPKIHVASTIRFGRTFSAEISVEDMGGGFSIPAASLGNKPAFSCVEDVRWQATPDWSVHAFVAYMRFAYGKSPISSGGTYEPDSRTSSTNYGLAVTYNLNA